MTQLSARAKITSGFSESFRRGIVTLPKIRNPKLEVRNKPEGPKSESQNHAAWRRFKPWNLRILDLFRISDFGPRICRPSNGSREELSLNGQFAHAQGLALSVSVDAKPVVSFG